MSLESFRSEVRTWLAGHCPPEMRTRMVMEEMFRGGRDSVNTPEIAREWFRAMRDKRWIAPTWPTEYGGGGLSLAEAEIIQQEMKAIGARAPVMGIGITMLGPLVLELGTEDQKRQHLPPIARGERVWAQGYSEPGAGSDLVSLSTHAEDLGDHLLLNGQKIWTSHGMIADWMFVLVRTDRTNKYGGITFVLLDTTTPGVDIRPIRLISGTSSFCETFFTDVKVPKSNVVGTINDGWNVAKRLLQYERTNISTSASIPTPLHDIARPYVGETAGQLADADLRARIADCEIAEAAYALTVQRIREWEAAGREIGALSSMIKNARSTILQRRGELQVEASGGRAWAWDDDPYYRREESTDTRGWLRDKAATIEGGTKEINLNVIARRILNLPEVR